MEFKKKIVLTVAIMGLGIASSQAQTGIGTNNPDNSAQLDITSAKRGLLMPRLNLVKTTEQTPIVGTAAKSLLVYNTATANDVTPGFYFWDSTKWIRITTNADAPNETLTTLGYNAANNELIYTDEKGIPTKLVLTANVGTQGPAGPKGEDGKDFTYADFTPDELAALAGKDGKGITATTVDAAGNLIVTYTDGTTANAGTVKGAQGEKGDKGDAGTTGATGETGPQGIQGVAGTPGAKGDKGDTGATGPQGPKGEGLSYDDLTPEEKAALTGIAGPAGPQGDKGDKGDTGSAGTAGATGPQGIQGIAGTPGAKGDKGDKGDTGSAGATGPQGIQGVAGTPGAKGDKGDTGAAGAQGPQGVAGRGINTTSINSSGDLVVTYSDAVSVNVGTVVGAKGEKGDTGATGPAGETGAKGDTGATGPAGSAPTSGAGNVTSKNLIAVTNGANNAFKDTEISLTPGTDKQIMQTDGTTPKWVNAAEVTKEPWYDATTKTGATANTQNIYQMGNVAIGALPKEGVALGVTGVARVGTDIEGYGFGIQGNSSMAVGSNIALVGNNSVGIGKTILLEADNAVAIGENAHVYEKETFAAGKQVSINKTNGGGAAGSVVFGFMNQMTTDAGQSSTMIGNALFGASNRIQANGGGTAELSENVVFGTSNSIYSNGNTNKISNIAIFGTGNETKFAGKGKITGTTIFGEWNIASGSNQFVLGRYNENVDNALFEMGIGDTGFRRNAVTVLNNGNAGIGTSAPTNTLHIKGTNPLKLEGLQTGTATDKILSADANGVVKMVDPVTVPTEPWFEVETNTQATTNTQNIYQTGNVAIGKNTVQAGAALDVKGAIRGGNTPATGTIGSNSIAVGDGLVVSGDNSAGFGSGNSITDRAKNTFLGGLNNKMNSVYSSSGAVIFGTGNAMGSIVSAYPRLDNSVIFGESNVVGSGGGGTTMKNSVAFGKANSINNMGNAAAFNNNTVFGTNNAINNVGGSENIENTTVFGENNIADKRNQFVIGSANENVANALFEVGNGASATARANALTILKNGNVGIGTSAPGTYKLLVNGQAGGTMAWSQSSDRRYKKDITPITGALDKIMKIEGVGYNWRTEEFKDKNFDNKHQLGVIAQDIEKILPDAVTKDDKGYYSVSYTTLVPVLVEAVKEQQKQIEELKALVKQLADKK